MADNSTQGGTDTIRDKDRAGVKTQIFGTDLNIGGASEVLETAAALADGTSNPTISGRSAFGMLWNGTTWDRAPGNAASGQKIQSAQLPSALVGGRLDINVGAITGTSVPINNIETLVDNAAFTDGTSKLFPQGYIFDETAGTGLTENDIAAARVDAKRAVVNVLEDATTRGRRVVVSPTGGLLGDQGAPAAQANAWFVRPRKLATYRAVYRTTTRPYNISKALTAGSRFQYATIHHAASATKTIRLRSVVVMIYSCTAGANIEVSLVRITTAPATGNPAITPAVADNADAAAEATCLALPTTNATEAAFFAQQAYALGITGALPTTNPPPPVTRVELLSAAPVDDERKPLVIRAGVLEGWAVTLDSDSAATVNAKVEIEFTEE